MQARATTPVLNQNHVQILRELIRQDFYIVKTDSGIFEMRDNQNQIVKVLQARNANRMIESGALIVMGTVATELGEEVRYDVTLLGRQLARGTNPRTFGVYKVFNGKTSWWRPIDPQGYTQGWTDDPRDAGRWTAGQARKFYQEFMRMASDPMNETAGYGYKEIG